MEECGYLRCLEPIWEELKDQLLVAVDAFCKSLPFTSSTQVSVFDLDRVVAKVEEGADEHSHVIEAVIEEANIQISTLKTEHDNFKKLAAIVFLRTDTFTGSDSTAR